MCDLCQHLGSGVNIMPLHQGWGWQPPQTASRIHIRRIQSVWAHWYAVYRHTVAAFHSYTQTTLLRLWSSGSHVESKWYHYIMVKAVSQLKLLPPSILDIYKVFKFKQWFVVHWHTVAALHMSHPPYFLAQISGFWVTFVELKWCHFAKADSHLKLLSPHPAY